MKFFNKFKRKIGSTGNKPSEILVDMVGTKILQNLDNIDCQITDYSQSFKWHNDGITVAGSANLHSRNSNTSDDSFFRKGQFESFAVKPMIKFDSVKVEITDKEARSLWKTIIEACKLKQQIDKEKAEYQRQHQAVDNIARFFERESDELNELKRLGEEALKSLPKPTVNPFETKKAKDYSFANDSVEEKDTKDVDWPN